MQLRKTGVEVLSGQDRKCCEHNPSTAEEGTVATFSAPAGQERFLPDWKPTGSWRWVWMILRVLVPCGAALYAFLGIDLRYLLESVRNYPPLWMLGALLVSFLGYLALSLRLQWMISPAPAFSTCLASELLCMGANCMFPARAGDVMKAVFLSKRLGLPLPQTVGYAFWERLFDLTLLLTLATFAFPLFHFGRSLVVMATLILGTWGSFLLVRLRPTVFLWLARRIPVVFLSRFLENLYQHAIADIRKGWLMRLGLTTVLVWTSYAGIYVISLDGVGGMSLGMEQILAVCVIGSLSTAVPVSPAGLGVYEGALVFALTFFGLPKTQSLCIALFMHALVVVPTSLAALWIMRKEVEAPGG